MSYTGFVGSSFHIENFGCRAARADGEAIAAQLNASGCSERQAQQADVIVVNTCSVTAEADREARAFIRRAHRLNPEARIVATGCYAQRAPEELAALAGVAAVVGNSHKASVPKIALGLVTGQDAIASNAGLVSMASLIAGSGSPLILADDSFAHSFLAEAQVVPGAQTRPNLKIQEGCGNRCSFCVIPQTRGSSRSLPGAAVMRQVEGFVAAGGIELVLSGINLGRWGRDLAVAGETNEIRDAWSPTLSRDHPTDEDLSAGTPVSRKDGARSSAATPASLASLVRQIFAQTELPRLRLSSIEPMDWDAELIGLMAEFGGPARSANPIHRQGKPGAPTTGPGSWGARLARHAHLPLQSGSDAVLRRMHRRYRPWHYAEKVAALVRAAGPELTLGADVMVGFPGETDAEFEETLEFVRALPFGYLHLFPFSPRPGTRAWALHAADPVAVEVVVERMAAMRALAAEKSLAHRQAFVGQELDAITLHTPEALAQLGRTSALTENFLPVEVDGSLPANQSVRVRVTGIDAQGNLSSVEAKELSAISESFAAD
ncbi:MAG: MiaB/RimO family radical SAM methylthiotransferase [Terracidiphilus sp.]